jgi:hypothetical protein
MALTLHLLDALRQALLAQSLQTSALNYQLAS